MAYAATRGWFGVACGRDFRSRLASSPRLENAFSLGTYPRAKRVDIWPQGSGARRFRVPPPTSRAWIVSRPFSIREPREVHGSGPASLGPKAHPCGRQALIFSTHRHGFRSASVGGGALAGSASGTPVDLNDVIHARLRPKPSIGAPSRLIGLNNWRRGQGHRPPLARRVDGSTLEGDGLAPAADDLAQWRGDRRSGS